MEKKLKSPLKAKPLRNPGESLQQEMDNIFYDNVLLYVMLSTFAFVIAGLEWWRWYAHTPPTPVLWTVLAVVLFSMASWKIRIAWKQIKNIKLGMDGEKAVGQFLERVREYGANVFHDVPAIGFNLDHVVIHSTGVYVIETKTFSKPDKGEAKLVYDGEQVLKNGFQLDRNPIVQVTAASKWLCELLENSTGRKFPIKSVVVFPGWFIEQTPEAKKSNVWVLNPKALPEYIKSGKEILQLDEVKMCSFHLSKYVRASWESI